MMNLSLGLWIVVAVLAAWAVGAHSRFKRLRSLCHQARESLVRHLNQIEQHSAPLALWVQTTGPDPRTLEQARAWLLQVRAVAQHPGAVPQGLTEGAGVLGGPAQGLGLQLRAVLEDCPVAQTDMVGDALPAALVEALLGALRDAQLRLSRYNAYVQEWNEAVRQRPAAWLARVAGMRQEPLL